MQDRATGRLIPAARFRVGEPVLPHGRVRAPQDVAPDGAKKFLAVGFSKEGASTALRIPLVRIWFPNLRTQTGQVFGVDRIGIRLQPDLMRW